MIDNVYDLITINMERLYAGRVAFRFYDEQTDTVQVVYFGDYAQDIRRAVSYFKATVPDIRGRRICLLSKNCYEYAVNSFGIMMAGGVLVPMNQRKTWDEMQHELQLVEPAAILTDGEDYGCRAKLEAAYGGLLRPMDGFRSYEPAELERCIDPEVLLDMAHNGMFVVQTYGSTETCGDGLVNYAQDAEHIGAIGRPDDHCEYKLDNGEICMRGGSVMLGYYKDPEATVEVIDAEGWFHTGDLAREDEQGYYFLVGRKKNVIILDSGENISPEELEKIVEKCPAVQECIVKELGKKIGVVVYCEQKRQQEVRDFVTEVNRTLPMYKRIAAVEFSAEPLPRNAAGKLERK